MASILGFRVQNFRTLKDITFGKLWNDKIWGQTAQLTPLTAVIGKNGVGKSTLFDAFGFLSDCLRHGLEEACDANGRGGFDRIRSQGQIAPISFEIYYKENQNSRPITYEVSFDADEHGRPHVLNERLRQRRSGQKTGWPFSFLYLTEGKGVAWVGDSLGVQIEDDHPFKMEDLLKESSEESGDTETVEMDDSRRLGIATLGSLRQHPRISAFRRFIEGWHLSYFTPDAARSLPMAGPQRQLNVHGDNVGNVVQYMEREQPKRFGEVLKRISQKIPGISSIDTKKTDDGRLLLRFNDSNFEDPFFAHQMSDGTLKVFAYLLLLEDANPPPFLCIEEPENGLYHKLLETLADEFRSHATGKARSSQIFLTTHQPYLVDALKPEEVWIMERGDDGFSKIRRASDDELVRNLVSENLPLGSLWYSDYLDIT
jgi:predicted ATPase